ncbi:MAG: maleylpyruvate isomerase N-terminal domain-containing protein [Calditrichaeota bacterium]|nr:maleylpyruvate isomerase N-terminal domain-containing protein [Calditrichota bacterium]
MMIDLVSKLPELDKKLIELLESLSPDEWQKQTVARLWKVKDVAAHLLDGNIRILSGLRDAYQGDKSEINSYQELVDYLNRLNADWVKAMKRVSPQILIDLLKHTGPAFCAYYASLNLFDKAQYSVAWAGENESKNWMHIAREYTEKFLHQQQIRDAVDKQGIMNREFYHPFLNVCMYALPIALKNAKVPAETVIKLTVSGEAGGSWVAKFNGINWELSNMNTISPEADITIKPDAAWKLFSKSKRAHELQDSIRITGNHELAEIALKMVSFMA